MIHARSMPFRRLQTAVGRVNLMDDDERINLQHQISDLTRRVENMSVALTQGGLDEVSLRVALAVEDQFAVGHPGGRLQRLAKIQLLIRHAVLLATRGQDRWDAWTPGSCGPAPTKPVGGEY
jgi:hypothetical protein